MVGGATLSPPRPLLSAAFLPWRFPPPGGALEWRKEEGGPRDVPQDNYLTQEREGQNSLYCKNKEE